LALAAAHFVPVLGAFIVGATPCLCLGSTRPIGVVWRVPRRLPRTPSRMSQSQRGAVDAMWQRAGMPPTSDLSVRHRMQAEMAELRESVVRLERQRDEARSREAAAQATASALESGTQRSGATTLAALSAARASSDEVRRLQLKVERLEQELRHARLREEDTARSFATHVASSLRSGAARTESARVADAARVRVHA